MPNELARELWAPRAAANFGGRWPLRPEMRSGEALSSYLIRAAHKNFTPPYSFFNQCWRGRAILTRDVDRAPELAWLIDVSRRSGVPLDTLQAGTISHLGAWAARPAPGDLPLILAVGVYHRKRRRHGLVFCPQCLRSGTPHFKIAWRMAFSFVCGECGQVLCDACPRCDAAIVPHLAPQGRLDLCHACCRRLTVGEVSVCRPSEEALKLQSILSRCMAGDPDATLGAFSSLDAVIVARSMLAVCRHAAILPRLRSELGLEPVALNDAAATIFEHARIPERLALCETLARWISDWPAAFLHGAQASGITVRTFARSQAGRIPAFRAVVAQLPDGHMKSRRPTSILTDVKLDRLRRVDKAAFRRARAEKILRAAGGLS